MRSLHLIPARLRTRSPFTRGAALGLLPALALALLALLPSRAPAATPAVVDIHDTDGTKLFQTALIGGVVNDPATQCVYGVSCDSLHVVIHPGNYTGKRLVISVDWLVPASDFDLYVFEGAVGAEQVGASTSSVPGGHEDVPIDVEDVVTTTRTLAVRVVAFATAPEQLSGTVQLVATPAPRTAILDYSHDITFCPNITVAAPVTTRDCEPSLRVDPRGNCYVGGIRGVPAGVDLWRFDLDPASSTYDPQLRNPFYLGQPDAFTPEDSTGGRDGGGDIDIATSFPISSSTVPIVTIVSLAAANISSAVSTDRGDNFALSPAVANVPADDRQWIEAAGEDTVYLFYRAPIPATGLFVQRSTDHGANYGLATLVSPSGTTPGYIDVDHTSGYVYVSHMSSSAVFVSRSTDRGATWQTFTADNSTGHKHLFDPVKVGDDGTVYVAWTDQHAVYLAHSTDHAQTWSVPVKVSGPETGFALMPWLEAGSAGRVAVVWYASPQTVNNNAGDWRAYMALTTNATAQNPIVRIVEVSDHVIHANNLSESGLGVDTPATPQPDRNLCDYFQVAIDPAGACVVAFTDDHNDFDGHTYVTRQLSGPSLYASANGGTGVLATMAPIPLPTPDPGEPEVSDFLHDATGSSLQPLPTDNPWDILSIDYDCANNFSELQVKMKVSQLGPVPPDAFWRVNFATNVTRNLTPDRGDQFFLQARTDTAGLQSFVFGTAKRDSNGDMSYVIRGPATFGVFDTTADEVVIRLAFTALDPYVAHGPPVRRGSALVGMRGQTGTLVASGARDETRGGGFFRVCPGDALAVDEPGDVEFGMSAPRPNPGRDGAVVNLSLPRAAWVELAVFDAQGRRVRTVQAGTLAAGMTTLRWDGRTDSGHPAASGAYFMRMIAGGKTRSQHLVLVR